MTVSFHDLIKDTFSWNDIYIEFVKKNVEKDRSAGKLFEQFCKYYYLSEPSVRNEYKNVWLFQEIPSAVKQKLNLGKIDHGIDLVLQGLDGSFSVVQCKFRNDQNSIISWTKDNLANLFADGDKADYFVVFTNSSGLDKHSLTKKMNKLKIVTLGDLLNISPSTIGELKKLAKGFTKISPAIKKPRSYQQNAIKAVVEGLKQNDRGQLILPCGAGKTLVSLWIKDALKAKHTLVLVPSLALLRQVREEWAANSQLFTPYICVCSEKDIDKGGDLAEVHTYEIGGKVSTDPNEIREFLNSHDKSIVYSTYQSLDAICKAAEKSGFKFDLAICDEAHKTAGSKQSVFGLIHDDSNVLVKKRLYMTATPRVVAENLKIKLNDDQISYLCDMGNPKIFGPELFRMSFKEAIDKKILVDYQIVAVGVSEQELEKAIKLRRYISDHVTIDEVANNYALEKFMGEYQPTHAITFHSSVRKAKAFQERHNAIYSDVITYHVNGELTTNERNVRMNEFETLPKSVMTNARCLTEGIDMPAIDVVYFCDPKNSTIDIVQATGRALRRDDDKGKKLGYVVVPIFHHKQETVEIDIEGGPFKNLMSVVRSLSSQDERLTDEIRAIKCGVRERTTNTDHLSISSSCDLINLLGFNEKLKTSLFYQLISHTRIPYRNFKEARKFVHKLGLKNQAEWLKYCKSGMKPEDLPATPESVYKNVGWLSLGDWLGTGTIAPKDMVFRQFHEAREYVHSLELKSWEEWQKYSKSGKRPSDIPGSPQKTYKNKGWHSGGDWLGTNSVAPRDMVFRSFEAAREFIRVLGLTNQEDWRKYCKSGEKPIDIPANPGTSYKNKGWINMGDWLGTRTIATRDLLFRPFDEARRYVRTLKLKSVADWTKYCKSGKKPNDIPMKVYRTYKNKGWKSWGDWLGTETIATFNMVFRLFPEAKKFVHSLGLKREEDWIKYYKSGQKPNDIPADPSQVYKSKGWKSMGDWLGTGKIANRNMTFRSFSEARKFIHSLGLKTTNEWNKYCKSGKKPSDLPSNADKVYKNKGWKSWGDWLGTETIATFNIVYRPFRKAREFVHSLGLKSSADWYEYCQRGKKPSDIPGSPPHVYKNKGWKSWGDWLGTGKIAHRNMTFRSFKNAKEFVHSLKLKSESDWRKYCKSGKKPTDIPSNPGKGYKNKGWKSLGDWLGTKTIATNKINFLPFAEARSFVGALYLKGQKEWKIYCKTGNKPNNIPAAPWKTYKNKGWVSISDWLGKKTKLKD